MQFQKVKFDNYEDKVECQKCNNMTESSEEGYYCMKCKILFNICKNCNDGTLLYLKAWVNYTMIQNM